jgi:hypothetical protein
MWLKKSWYHKGLQVFRFLSAPFLLGVCAPPITHRERTPPTPFGVDPGGSNPLWQEV